MSTYPPLARAYDPPSSHEAARLAPIATQEAQTVAALHAHAGVLGVTSKRLAELSGLDRHMLARRLPGLRDRGLVLEDRSRGEIRWLPVARQGDLFAGEKHHG